MRTRRLFVLTAATMSAMPACQGIDIAPMQHSDRTGAITSIAEDPGPVATIGEDDLMVLSPYGGALSDVTACGAMFFLPAAASTTTLPWSADLGTVEVWGVSAVGDGCTDKHPCSLPAPNLPLLPALPGDKSRLDRFVPLAGKPTGGFYVVWAPGLVGTADRGPRITGQTGSGVHAATDAVVEPEGSWPDGAIDAD